MRLEDWQSRLAAFVEARRAAPFEWGVNDCAAFARDAVAEITGADPAGKELRRHRSAAGARRALGGANLRDMVSTYLPEIAPAFAQRGDVVLAAVDGRELLGICLGDAWASPAERGLAFRPMAEVVAAWKVA